MSENQDIPDVFKNVFHSEDEESKRLENQAQKVIQSLSQTYLKNVHVQISDLERYIEQIHQANLEHRLELEDNIFRIAHNIKGQGLTFGYPLLTALGKHICDLVRHVHMWDNSLIDIVEKDIMDMKTVIDFPANTQNDILNKIEQRLDKK